MIRGIVSALGIIAVAGSPALAGAAAHGPSVLQTFLLGAPQPEPCVVPDNGTGTVDLPPEGCAYLSPQEVHLIIDGLPPGTTIELDPIHSDFVTTERIPGGTLGGEIEIFNSNLILFVSGTGDLAGFNRELLVPILCEVHTGPRTPGEPLQEFPNDMYRIDGNIFGDPDFDWLIITGGTDYGMPGPGQTVLTELPTGDFNIDSFFDISYEITFTGAPGSILEGLGGTTTGTLRMQTGDTVPPPNGACCHPDGGCLETEEVDCTTGDWRIFEPCEPNPCPQPSGACCAPDGSCTFTIEADCPDQWLGMGTACEPDNPCPQPPGACCAPDGSCTMTEADDCPDDWLGVDTACEPNPCLQPPEPCVEPGNGSGTVNLPPEDCAYLSPDEVHMIIDGLPPGTTIELDPIHDSFMNTTRSPGGTLGGEVEEFDSRLGLIVRGTGELAGFVRLLDVPLACEVHTGPREPGTPLQEFANDMYRLQGDIGGDPDFAELVIIGGTGFGLPSPGQTTLTELPSGDFNVDSFFDITYQIGFVGAPGSVLDGLSGQTTGNLRMRAGEPVPPPSGACCAPDGSCLLAEEVDCATGDWRVFEVCEPNPCPFPEGACCAPDGSCTVTTEAACAEILWTEGVDCDPNPCPPPLGACCAPDLSCTMTTEADCDDDWIGEMYECEPENPCPEIATEETSWGSIKATYR